MRLGMKRLAVVALAVLIISPLAYALTYQDKADLSIRSDGNVSTINGGTPLHLVSSVQTLNAANSNTVTITTVPTGYVYHITDVGYTYTGTTTNVRVSLLANDVTVDQDGAPTTKEANHFKTDLWLAAGETLKITAIGYTVSDTLQGYAQGRSYTAQ